MGQKQYQCVVLDDYQNVAKNFADWQEISSRVNVEYLHNHLKENDLINKIKHADILVIMRERTIFNKKLLQQLPNLKLLITSGMRNNAIDLSYTKENNIIVCGTESSSTPPLELTWALILSLLRNIVLENNNLVNNKNWQSSVGVDLSGKTLGLVGIGKIGSLMVPIAKSFGMKVLGWSPNLTIEKSKEKGAEFVTTKEELFEKSDIVSLHLVLSEKTKNIIDENTLNKLKTSSYLINTSRSALVDTHTLIKLLQNNQIKGAAMDVFDIEPLPSQDILRKIPNLLATPHLGYVTENNYKKYFTQAVENIAGFLNNNLIRVINR